MELTSNPQLQAIAKLLGDVFNERMSQIAKWGVQNHNIEDWMLILAEEYGEAAKEANEVRFRKKDPANYRVELVQTAAVCLAAIEALDNGYT